MTGRRRKYETPDEFEKKIDEYFKYCEGELALDADGQPRFTRDGLPCYLRAPSPPTMTGLALYLGFTSRQALLNYKPRGSAYFDALTRARSRVEAYAEARLYDRDGQRGAEFNLKCNFGWGAANNDGDDKLDALLRGLREAARAGPPASDGGESE